MSMLIHRCFDCDHPDFFHGKMPGDCSYGACRCDQNANPEPEWIPTFNPTTGALDERVIQPGESFHQNLKACGCDRCVQIVGEL